MSGRGGSGWARTRPGGRILGRSGCSGEPFVGFPVGMWGVWRGMEGQRSSSGGAGWSVTPGVTRDPGSERGSQDDFWEYGVGVWTRAADWGPRRLGE